MPAIYAKTEQIVSTLTPSMLERLDRFAAAHEQSRAEAVRRMIETAIADWEDSQ
jgi:metal-responsive CopG/Arc/MetJ family transcriptional regulator